MFPPGIRGASTPDLFGNSRESMSFLDRTGTRSYERVVRVSVLCLLWTLPGLASAETWVTSDGEPPRNVRRNVLLMPEDGVETLVQTWTLEGAAGPFVHLESFPSPPEVEAFVPRLQSNLAELCTTSEPLYRKAQRRPLGPSLASLLLPDAPAPPPIIERPEPETLAATSRRVVSGPVISSTVARGGFVWPEALSGLMARHGLEPSISTIRQVAQSLNGGGTVVATLYQGEGPGPHRIGPVRTRFPSATTVLPVPIPGPGEELELISLSNEAWQPKDQPVRWSTTPWRRQALATEEWVANCALELSPAEALPFEEAFGVEVTRLVRWRWAPPPTTRGVLVMVPTEFQPVPAEGSGTPSDMLKLLVLALLPLFLAPEAWALAWLQSGWQRRVWTLWPVAVALYWVWVLPGQAKWAALGPVLAGAAHAFWPSEQASRPFHRARLPRSSSAVSRSS